MQKNPTNPSLQRNTISEQKPQPCNIVRDSNYIGMTMKLLSEIREITLIKGVSLKITSIKLIDRSRLIMNDLIKGSSITELAIISVLLIYYRKF